jgi:2-polyprenyl-3-methyl-5-hydroxy-6-metoxy-1,4-benzoquinol methylase
MSGAANEDSMRAAPHRMCDLCGSEGRSIYRDQPDRLFGAGGLWSFKGCSNPQCGLVWLDPMPLANELWKAYARYYTHATTERSDAGLLRRSYRRLKSAYLARRYGYAAAGSTRADWWLGCFLYLLPIQRVAADEEVRFLPAKSEGRLLDVGCGSGEWMVRMRGLGWQVEGLDFDERAVRVARDLGLRVGHGALEEQRYPAGSFDAVTLNHVIEHVPAPVETLTECARILKPGGKLYLATPNSRALGHRIFGPHWRGLEVPRHLHIFSPESMKRLLEAAGLPNNRTRTINSPYVWRHSIAIWSRKEEENPVGMRGVVHQGLAGLFTLLEQVWLLGQTGAGECLSVIAVKD